MSDKVTAPKILASKGKRIVCVTAYDAIFAKLADEAGVDIVLVGDSVGNTVMGYDSTLPVTLSDMVYHTRAVSRGLSRPLLVSDLPFGSYQVSVEQAVHSAIELVKAGAEAVKLEGNYSEAIAAIHQAGIPVMGHLGMTPQSVNQFGGFKVQGKGEAGKKVLEDSISVANAGAFAVVLELIPSDLAELITRQIPIPTIGIGAGPQCDGQIQVIYDVLGISPNEFRHARKFVSGRDLLREGLVNFANSVRSGEFPPPETDK